MMPGGTIPGVPAVGPNALGPLALVRPSFVVDGGQASHQLDVVALNTAAAAEKKKIVKRARQNFIK